MNTLAATDQHCPTRSVITSRSWGWCYLLHFDKPLGNLANPRAQARHYTGWAADPNGDGSGLDQRIAAHLAGRGAKITRAAIEHGIALTVVATWRAPLSFEQTLKRRKNGPSICPICCQARGRTPKQPTIPACQLTLPLVIVAPWPADFEFPPPPSLSYDWYEISLLCRWRTARVCYPTMLPDDWDEGLL